MKLVLRLSITTIASAILFVILIFGTADKNVSAQQGDSSTATPQPESKPPEIELSNEQVPYAGKTNALKYNRMTSLLNEIVMQYETGTFSEKVAATNAPLDREGSVAVTLYITTGSAESIRDFLTANGASPRNIGADYIEAYVPVSLLAKASEQEGVVRIQTIIPPQPQQGTTVSGGVTAHGVSSWHATGYKGSGVKIGVIDIAFKDFAGLQGSDLPSIVRKRCYIDIGIFTPNLSDCDDTGLPESSRQHGTAVTEAVFDIAPEATYYIANPLSYGDLLSTTNWMVEQGVDVINMSLSWSFSGPGDGTSHYSNAPIKSVDAAVNGGIVWVNAAGNSARDSWYGAFADSNSNGFLEFATSGNECNHLTVNLDPLEGITAQLRWDDSWGRASKDLDLYLISEPGSTFSLSDAFAASVNNQTGAADDIPYERISLEYGEITNGIYCLAVRKYAGTVPSWVQLRVWGNSGDLQNYVAARSIGNPAESRNSGMLAVGAAHHSSTSAIESFSSLGPTIDNRNKPDIVGADGGNSSIWGPWYGTSQASPHVAGLAALVRQRLPDDTPEQVANYLKSSAEPRGTVPNNTWGHGFAFLPEPVAAEPHRYDLNRNGNFEKEEVLKAINDYLFGDGLITKEEVLEIINAYLFG